MQLNSKQQYAFGRIAANKNIFLTGSGGVGKSVIVRKVQDQFEDSTMFLAPTGVAAQNIQGSTIHSIFKFPFGFISASVAKKVSDKTREIFQDDSITRIVIDEISMNRADLFSAIDKQLRLIKRRNVPFGGIQIVTVGDFYQLPPVINTNSSEGQEFRRVYKSPYAFSSDSWENAGFETIELDQVMRQSDKEMIFALNSIRKKDENFKTSLAYINIQGHKNILSEELDPVFLCAYNADAEFINNEEFAKIDGKERSYKGKKTPGFKDCPVPETINLKLGCKVLICANNAKDNYFNGQTGHVLSMFDKMIVVQLNNGEVVNVVPNTWTEYDYEHNGNETTKVTKGSFTQFPLKLGYAVSIHKSQGLTLDSAVIYTGRGLFAHGQGYVALSRIKSMSGLCLVSPIKESEIIVDPYVHEFYNGNVVKNLL